MTALVILAVLAAIVGIIGSIVPGLPGPPVSWVGFLLVFFAKSPGADGDPMSLSMLMIWLGVVVVVTVLDYVLPAKFTKLTGGHKAAATGALLGLVAGLVIPPVGMIAGSLLGAFIAELVFEDRGVWDAFKASVGAFIGFVVTTGLKLAVSGVMAYYIFVYAF